MNIPRIPLGALGALTGLSLAAFAAEPPVTLSLDVHPTTSGGTSKVEKSTHDSHSPSSAHDRHTSQKREEESKISLQAEVRNIASSSTVAYLDWTFFTNSAGGAKEAKPFDRGYRSIFVDSSSAAEAPLVSKVSHLTETRTKGRTETTGDRVDGWVVRLLVNRHPVVIKASSESLEELGKTLPPVEPPPRTKAAPKKAAVKVVKKTAAN